MIRTYVFGCPSNNGEIGRLAVNVTLAQGQLEEARAKAFEVAGEQAVARGMSLPKLMYEAGVPDIRIILEGGKVAAAYYRNSDLAPSISVSDLDYSDDPEKDSDKLLADMEREGYAHMAFYAPAPCDPRQPSS